MGPGTRLLYRGGLHGDRLEQVLWERQQMAVLAQAGVRGHGEGELAVRVGEFYAVQGVLGLGQLDLDAIEPALERCLGARDDAVIGPDPRIRRSDEVVRGGQHAF